MNYQMLLALLTKVTDLGEAEAELIAKDMQNSIQPATFKEAVRRVEDILASHKKKIAR